MLPGLNFKFCNVVDEESIKFVREIKKLLSFQRTYIKLLDQRSYIIA